MTSSGTEILLLEMMEGELILSYLIVCNFVEILHSSVTTSLASSVMDFRHEHGRRYHAFRDGSKCSHQSTVLIFANDNRQLAYLVPNDEVSSFMKVVNMHIPKCLFSKRSTAPVEVLQ